MWPVPLGPTSTDFATFVRDELIREFTAHSRPHVTIERSTLADRYEIRVRIFGDLHVVSMIDVRSLTMLRPDGLGNRVAILATITREIVNNIRRAPATQDSGRASVSGNQSALGDHPLGAALPRAVEKFGALTTPRRKAKSRWDRLLAPEDFV